MGPGCFYPGNDGSVIATGALAALQWGRDVSIPEMPPPVRGAVVLTGFNGAGMFLSRK